MIHRPYLSAIFLSFSIFTGYPAKSTGMIPRNVPGSLSASIFSSNPISIRYERPSISQKETSPPQKRTQLALAIKVSGEVITLSPSFTFNAMADICRAAVPVARATAYLTPVYFAKACSNSSTLGPCVIKSDIRVSLTALKSSSVMA